MNDATAASVNAQSMKLLHDARMLEEEAKKNIDVSEHLDTASHFLRVVAELEQAGIEHSDATMITLLIGLRERKW